MARAVLGLPALTLPTRTLQPPAYEARQAHGPCSAAMATQSDQLFTIRAHASPQRQAAEGKEAPTPP